jgi:acylphosphatase
MLCRDDLQRALERRYIFPAQSEEIGRRIMDEVATVRVLIKGRVQGVWYRGWTLDQARRLGLAGWVRNRLDGSVEAVFSGPEPKVRAMVEYCRKAPPAARVSEITEQVEAAPVGPGFRQAPTV